MHGSLCLTVRALGLPGEHIPGGALQDAQQGALGEVFVQPQQMDQLGVLVARLTYKNIVLLRSRAELHQRLLRQENTMSALVLHHPQRRVARHENLLGGQREDAEPLKVHRELQKFGKRLLGQPCRLVVRLGPRARGGQLHRVIGRHMHFRIDGVSQQASIHPGVGVPLLEVLEDLHQLAPLAEHHRLVKGGGVELGEHVKLGVDLILRHRRLVTHQCLQMLQIMLILLLDVRHPGQRSPHVILHREQIGQILATEK
mmetsp:Transcript_10521/g.26736  ORF Transcript_10521/g.26736 Transcript_10521/m.26736 type:complete len:257 (+) Transcript_10521:474-1244(+)